MRHLLLILFFMPFLVFSQPGQDLNEIAKLATRTQAEQAQDSLHRMTPKRVKQMMDYWALSDTVQAGTQTLSVVKTITVNHNQNIDNYYPELTPIYPSALGFSTTVFNVFPNSFQVLITRLDGTLGWTENLIILYTLNRL